MVLKYIKKNKHGGCEIEVFVETHVRYLATYLQKSYLVCVILRSRVLILLSINIIRFRVILVLYI